jgi:hypothetical protein
MANQRRGDVEPAASDRRCASLLALGLCGALLLPARLGLGQDGVFDEANGQAPMLPSWSDDPFVANPDTFLNPPELRETYLMDDEVAAALNQTVSSAAILVAGVVYLLSAAASRDDARRAEVEHGDLELMEDLRAQSDRDQLMGLVLTTIGLVGAASATELWMQVGDPDVSSGEGNENPYQ